MPSIHPAEAAVEGLTSGALARLLPAAQLDAALATARPGRCRKLPARFMLLFCVLMGLYADEALPHVCARLVGWCAGAATAAGGVTAGALCQARYRLGARPVVALFRLVCRPLATPTTPGAFLFGRRVLALDSTRVDVPDTPANEAAFGRHRAWRGTSAWPQLRLVLLAECATHAICDAGIWPGNVDEGRAGRRLLRGVGPEALVLWDRGFQSVAMMAATLARGAAFLARLPAGAKPRPLETLPDGTTLVALHPGWHRGRGRAGRVVARLIRYTLDDPRRPGPRLEHRLVTSLLDPAEAPARDLIVAYHQRWEVELAVDELKAHQRPARPLRSRLPVGVVQEVYGLLIAHYLLRALAAEAARGADAAPTRVSFLAALRLVRAHLSAAGRPRGRRPAAATRGLLRALATPLLPPRRNRSNPRVVKRKMTNFRVKTPAHRDWPQPAEPFAETIVLLI